MLRKKAKAVKRVTPEITQLIADMAETMYAAPGVGLAAPQVGRNLRVIIVDIGQGLLEMVNPKLISKEGNEIGEEGCLSVPGVCGYVERSFKIKVKGLGKSGEQKEIDADGFLARAIQHEMDHLEGILFIDKLVPMEQVEAKKEKDIVDSEECKSI